MTFARLTVLLVTLVAVSWVMMNRLARLNEEQVERSAQDIAMAMAVQIREMNYYYTANAVGPALDHGMKVTHEFKETPNAIPLPFTMTHDIARAVSEQTNIKVRYFSNYPFPFRKDGGPHDEFEKQALTTFAQNASQPFYAATAKYEGVESYRYVVPHIMREKCVTCHNSHPQSPKTDWKVGDVRGVLEIAVPLDKALAASKMATRRLYWSMIGAVVVVMAVFLGLFARGSS